MNFDFNETHLMIRDTARKFAEEKLAPSADERDEKEQFPFDAIKEMGELGFMGMMVSEKYGGAALDTISYVLAMEEISKVDASAGVVMSVNNSLVCWGIETYGSEQQKEKYLRDLATGKKLGAFALSEPEAGSDATNQRTTAVRNGDHYVLNGMKNFITNGANADVVIVMAPSSLKKDSMDSALPRKRRSWESEVQTQFRLRFRMFTSPLKTESAKKDLASSSRSRHWTEEE
jgi:alkylation response protein AidB-like acyl-CoA dehydrogenase